MRSSFGRIPSQAQTLFLNENCGAAAVRSLVISNTTEQNVAVDLSLVRSGASFSILDSLVIQRGKSFVSNQKKLFLHLEPGDGLRFQCSLNQGADFVLSYDTAACDDASSSSSVGESSSSSSNESSSSSSSSSSVDKPLNCDYACYKWTCPEAKCDLVLQGCPDINDPCIDAGNCCETYAGLYDSNDCAGASCPSSSSSILIVSSSSSSLIEVPCVDCFGDGDGGLSLLSLNDPPCCADGPGGGGDVHMFWDGYGSGSMASSLVFFDDNLVLGGLSPGEHSKLDHYAVDWFEVHADGSFGAIISERRVVCMWPQTNIAAGVYTVGSVEAATISTSCGTLKTPPGCQCVLNEPWCVLNVRVLYDRLGDLQSFGGLHWESLRYISSNRSSVTPSGFTGSVGNNATFFPGFRVSSSSPSLSEILSSGPVSSYDSGALDTIRNVSSLARDIETWKDSGIVDVSAEVAARRDALRETARVPSPDEPCCCGAVDLDYLDDNCCSGEDCDKKYCHYRASIRWAGEGEGAACPSGFAQSGLNEGGKRMCLQCATILEPLCDDFAWWEGIRPEGDWVLELNSLGHLADCSEQLCGGVCDPDYSGSCCNGCSCVEVEFDGETFYQCETEPPPE